MPLPYRPTLTPQLLVHFESSPLTVTDPVDPAWLPTVEAWWG